jgi:hypothetical protein
MDVDFFRRRIEALDDMHYIEMTGSYGRFQYVGGRRRKRRRMMIIMMIMMIMMMTRVRTFTSTPPRRDF